MEKYYTKHAIAFNIDAIFDVLEKWDLDHTFTKNYIFIASIATKKNEKAVKEVFDLLLNISPTTMIEVLVLLSRSRNGKKKVAELVYNFLVESDQLLVDLLFTMEREIKFSRGKKWYITMTDIENMLFDCYDWTDIEKKKRARDILKIFTTIGMLQLEGKDKRKYYYNHTYCMSLDTFAIYTYCISNNRPVRPAFFILRCFFDSFIGIEKYNQELEQLGLVPEGNYLDPSLIEYVEQLISTNENR